MTHHSLTCQIPNDSLTLTNQTPTHHLSICHFPNISWPLNNESHQKNAKHKMTHNPKTSKHQLVMCWLSNPKWFKMFNWSNQDSENLYLSYPKWFLFPDRSTPPSLLKFFNFQAIHNSPLVTPPPFINPNHFFHSN